MSAAAEQAADMAPAVKAMPWGTVTVELDPDQAQVLARILAHYDELTRRTGYSGHAAAEGYDSLTWHHTLIGLMTEHSRCTSPLPDIATAQLVDADETRHLLGIPR